MKKFIQFITANFIATVFMFPVLAQTKAAAFKLPHYEKFVLPNGLTIYLMEQHEVPLINVAAIIPAGAIYDGDKNGLASLTAECLQHGTKNYTKQAIEEELDYIGASINSYANKESAGLSAKFVAKDQDKVLGIVREILLTPVFNLTEFEKEKKRTLVNLEQAKERPRQVIGGYWDKFLYGDHVYGNLVSGNTESISKLSREDLMTFYKANYIPNGSAIAVAGDFNSNAMKLKLIELFSAWKKSNQPQQNLASKPIVFPSSAKVLLEKELTGITRIM
jgi:zinc protease